MIQIYLIFWNIPNLEADTFKGAAAFDIFRLRKSIFLYRGIGIYRIT